MDLLPGEAATVLDEQTGVEIVRLTNHPSVNHNLYYLNNSFSDDGQSLVFTSYRAGKADLYSVNSQGGPIARLTDVEELFGYSGHVSGSTLFYTAADTVCKLNLTTLEKAVLARFPGCTLGECRLNHDGTRILTTCIKDGEYAIVVVDTNGKDWEYVIQGPKPILHPQWPPNHSEWILYASDPLPRLWRVNVDGSEDTCLYHNKPREFFVHETFLGQTDQVIFAHWPYALKKIDPYNCKIETIAAINAWHIASSPDGRWIVCDTVHPDIGLRLINASTGHHVPLCYPQSSSQGTQWEKDYAAGALPEESAAGAPGWETMKITGDTLYGPQWTHPHPSFSPDGKRIVFCSDHPGYPQVHVATIPERLIASQ